METTSDSPPETSVENVGSAGRCRFAYYGATARLHSPNYDAAGPSTFWELRRGSPPSFCILRRGKGAVLAGGLEGKGGESSGRGWGVQAKMNQFSADAEN